MKIITAIKIFGQFKIPQYLLTKFSLFNIFSTRIDFVAQTYSDAAIRYYLIKPLSLLSLRMLTGFIQTLI